MSAPSGTGPADSGGLRRGWPALLGFAVAALAVLGYRAIGEMYYRGYAFPQGGGMGFLLPDELAFIAVYVSMGGVAAGALAFAFWSSGLGRRAISLVRWLAERPRAVAIGVALAVTVAAWIIGALVLGHAVTTDDEHVYQFIAQTLRTGHLTAPSPGHDLAFYREQFVVLTPTVRFGKYPIGFPLLLALGQALGREEFVVPLITGLLALTLAWLVRRSYGKAVSVVALALFAISPQVLTTGASYLSQPAASLFLLLGVAAMLEAERAPRPAPWLLLAGAALGYGAIVRPLPGALFAAAAALYELVHGTRPRWRGLVALATPLALAAGALLLINRIQSGGALTSGYQAFHKTGEGATGLLGLLGGGLGERSMSLFSNLYRLNVWLFGWPLSLIALPFAPRRRESTLLWLMIAAELAYRLISAKAGAGGTGPAYLFEIVPLLCLLSADGMVRLAREGWRELAPMPEWVASLAVASTVVGAIGFVPARMDDLWRMGTAQRTAPALIAERGLHHALVFHDGIVPDWLLASWAYYPRCNSPALDDDVLYILYQPRDPASNLEFWRRRYPDRSAWFFDWPKDGEPALVELPAFVTQQERTPGKP